MGQMWLTVVWASSGVWVVVLSTCHISQGHHWGWSVGVFLWLKLLLQIKKQGVWNSSHPALSVEYIYRHMIF